MNAINWHYPDRGSDDTGLLFETKKELMQKLNSAPRLYLISPGVDINDY